MTTDDKLIRAAKLARRDQVLMEKRAAKQQRRLQRKCFWTGPRWGHSYEQVTEEVPSPTSAEPDRVVMVKLRQCVACHKQVI